MIVSAAICFSNALLAMWQPRDTGEESEVSPLLWGSHVQLSDLLAYGKSVIAAEI